MSGDLIASLRALAAAQHADLSLAADAVIEIERLTRERDEARAGIERLRKDLRQGFPIRYETAAGCLCPAGANASCQNAFCPRRNPPGVTCGGGRP